MPGEIYRRIFLFTDLLKMANRVLRDWTASEMIDRLSEGAEVFFTRLIMKADDFGYYHGNPKLLNSTLYPLRDLDQVNVRSWRDECVEAGVLLLYLVDGKEYLKIINFGQRLRSMVSKFPQETESAVISPPVVSISRTNVSGPPSSARTPPLEGKGRETEVETETETEGEGKGREEPAPDFEKEIFGDQLFLEQLRRLFPAVELKSAWAECALHFKQQPRPPDATWIWRQKFQTWLSIKQKNSDEQRAKAKGILGQKPPVERKPFKWD